MQGLKPGGNDYLTKPVNREELAVRIKNLSDLKKAIKKNNEISQKLLQKRMTPHFIFNTLNSIHSYLHFDIEKADDALMQLAHCFRFLTNNSFESLITFDMNGNLLSSISRSKNCSMKMFLLSILTLKETLMISIFHH